jgi:hypothetical protein
MLAERQRKLQEEQNSLPREYTDQHGIHWVALPNGGYVQKQHFMQSTTWAERKAAGFQRQREYEQQVRDQEDITKNWWHGHWQPPVSAQQPPPPVVPAPTMAPAGVIPVDLEPDVPALCSMTRAISHRILLLIPCLFLVFLFCV